jgi:acyl-CoA synthetase (AMP-forming)/AMP-acid ligase II
MPLIDLLSRQPAAALAFLSPDRPPLTYGGLAGLAGRTVAALNGRGIGRRHRVAIVLPNGPDMAAAFLAIGAGAATAPLNPAYRADGSTSISGTWRPRPWWSRQGWRPRPARRPASSISP